MALNQNLGVEAAEDCASPTGLAVRAGGYGTDRGAAAPPLR